MPFTIILAVSILILNTFSSMGAYDPNVLKASSKNPCPSPGEGEWIDGFWYTNWLDTITNTDIYTGSLRLALVDRFNWIQTTNSDFSTGSFFQTEAVSIP